MSSHPVKPEIDALLDIARLRTLARHLVADPLTAEDLIQDAWVAALARPAPPRDLGAWLAGAVRHLARRARRGAERRTRREAAGARGEAVPSALELSERSELLERLLAAVRALDEPYRTTVLLHYVEGWTLERIAQQADVPASTVRNRLARALERLRERLDREARGDRSVWLSALAPFARLPDPAGASITTLAMGTTTKLILSAAAVSGALLAFLVPVPAGAGDAVAALEVVRAPDEVRDERAGLGQLDAQPVSASRTPLAPEESDGAGSLVYGALAGAGGEAVTEGWVSFTDPLGEAHQATLGAGAYSIVGLEAGAWSVRADCEGFRPRCEELVLDAGREATHLDLVLEPSTSVRVKFVDRQGQSIVDATSNRFDALPLAAIATRERPGERISGVRGRIPASHGAGVYRSPTMFGSVEGLPPEYAGLLELRAPPPLWISAVLGDVVLQSRLDDGRAGEIVFELERAEIEIRGRGGLRARLVDAESGAPLSGTAALQFEDMSGGGPPIQPDGTIEFRDEVVGLRELELRAAGHELFKRTVRLRSGETIDLGTLALHRERSIRGHLSDEEGRPLATGLTWTPAALVASALDLDQRIGGKSGPDGSFKLFGTGSGEVLLFAERGDHAANPIRIPPGGDTEFDAVARRGTLVVIHPLRHGGPGALFAVADERGSLFWTADVWEQRPLRLRLVPGTYQLWTGRDELVERVETITVGNETLVLER